MRLYLLGAILIACGFVGCNRSGSTSPSNNYALDASELKLAINKAEAGDIDAMNILVDYYWLYRDDGKEEGLYWLKRASSAGDVGARKAYDAYCGEHAEMKGCQR